MYAESKNSDYEYLRSRERSSQTAFHRTKVCRIILSYRDRCLSSATAEVNRIRLFSKVLVVAALKFRSQVGNHPEPFYRLDPVSKHVRRI